MLAHGASSQGEHWLEAQGALKPGPVPPVPTPAAPKKAAGSVPISLTGKPCFKASTTARITQTALPHIQAQHARPLPTSQCCLSASWSPVLSSDTHLRPTAVAHLGPMILLALDLGLLEVTLNHQVTAF